MNGLSSPTDVLRWAEPGRQNRWFPACSNTGHVQLLLSKILGAAEVGTPEVGQHEEGRSEVDFAKVSAYEFCRHEIGPSEIGLGELGAMQFCLRQNRIWQLGAKQKSLSGRFSRISGNFIYFVWRQIDQNQAGFLFGERPPLWFFRPPPIQT